MLFFDLLKHISLFTIQELLDFVFLVDCFLRAIIAFPSFQVFHYQSVAYPASVGRFKDRISWVGNAAKGDASIAIQSPSVSDNGTFICSVKNPPDVYHNIPQTVLIVTERGKPLFRQHSLTCVIQLHCGSVWTLTIWALHMKLFSRVPCKIFSKSYLSCCSFIAKHAENHWSYWGQEEMEKAVVRTEIKNGLLFRNSSFQILQK